MADEPTAALGFLSRIWQGTQQVLFPNLEMDLAPISEREKEFARMIELVQVDQHIGPYRWVGVGRKPHDRLAIAHAFLAKAHWNLTETKRLIEMLKSSPTISLICGWKTAKEIPSESVFCRAFREFSDGNLLQLVHETMIRNCLGDKIIGHISRDSTAIPAREKPIRKPKEACKEKGSKDKACKNKACKKKACKKNACKKTACKKKAVRRKAVRHSPSAGELKRLDIQVRRTMAENIADLPRQCDIGVKKNSMGHVFWWIGYKLHIDTMDGDIPVSAILTSASLHDSQAAVPLIQMSTDRHTYLYDLSDSAYDAKRIKDFSREQGHVPITAPNNRRRKVPVELDPAEKVRYRCRSSAERVNSNLKDNYGVRIIRVRGAAKVMAQLMFAIIALCANQLFRLIQ